ncbi:MAG UNVERIFIED_CONTAM: glycosyltransferase family 2 protein [Planctomycetaceae bacterium]
MKISVVIFFFNEADNLPVLKQRVAAVQKASAEEFEVVLVNDSSTDNSDTVALQWINEIGGGIYLRFSRNFGSHAAVAAGLRHCTGDCAVIMAADLQDPPEVIPELVATSLEGYDVVWACRSERLGESWFTKTSAALYYRLMRWLGLPNMPPKGADFLLVSRKVIDAVNASPEKHTSVLAMILWMGFRQTFIQYVKQARHSGQSKWTLSKKIKLLIDSVVSFSYVPIRAASVAGLVMAIAGFGYAGWISLFWLLGRVTSGTGYAAIMCSLLIGQGAILLTLGILGEYLWRTFDESRRRPRFIIDQLLRSPGYLSDSPDHGHT